MAPETERTAKKHNHPFNAWLDQEPSGHIICGGSLKRALNVLFSARFASQISFSGILSDLSWSHVAFCECFFFKFPVRRSQNAGGVREGLGPLEFQSWPAAVAGELASPSTNLSEVYLDKLK